MIEAEAKLDELEDSLRQLRKVFNILIFLITTDQRGQTLYASLKKVESLVRDINDERLMDLYNQIFAVFLTGIPHQQIRPDDYFAFLQRLGSLPDETTVQANEADIALREIIGLQSVIGIWGSREWRPQSQP
jgi:hypothetical protein